jgi:hypothetical protein
MSVITPEGTLIIENSHLDVRGNVNAVALKLGTLRLTPSYDLAAVTGVGNTTPYTVEFSNATTGLATTSNLQVGGTLKLGGTVDFENPLSLAAVSLVSNTTPYTIEFSNAATGIATTANVDVGGELAVTGNATVSSNLTVTGNATVSSNLTVSGNATVGEELTVTGNATMTSNLTVTGDLNVSGALGILDAIYPVGTVIDRATAITDTHLNGKYKAFLGAPNQEWELVDNGSNAVLEYLTQDGTTTSFCGRASLVPATAVQDLTTTFTEITGSAIGNFLPVVGTKKIKYSFMFVNRSVLFNLKFQFKVHNDSNYSGAWQEVSDATFDFHQYSTQPENFTGNISCVFTLDDVDNEDEGRIAATRPELSFRVVGREHDAQTYTSVMHALNYNFSGNGGHATAGSFKPPQITLISLGTRLSAYQRTA